MKKIILISFITIALFSLVVIFIPKKTNNHSMLVIQKKYHIHTSATKDIRVPIFLSKKMKNIVTNETYGFIHNKDMTKKILVDKFSQIEIHNETLNKDTYYGYEINIELPEIKGIVSIDDLYLTLYDSWVEGTYQLGTLYLTNEVGINDLFKVKGLYGSKNESIHLNQIFLSLDLPNLVDEIFIAGVKQDYFIVDDEIIININQSDLYYNDPYLIIYKGDDFQVVDNFTYFIHYELLVSELYIVYPY